MHPFGQLKYFIYEYKLSFDPYKSTFTLFGNEKECSSIFYTHQETAPNSNLKLTNFNMSRSKTRTPMIGSKDIASHGICFTPLKKKRR